MKNRVLILLYALFVLVVIGVIGFCRRKPTDPTDEHIKKYELRIEQLQDSIEQLQNEIDVFSTLIEKQEAQKEAFKDSIKLIVEEYEKSKHGIAVGDVDHNIQFLTKFLSEGDSERE